MSDTTQILTRSFDAATPTRVRDYVDLLKPRVMSLVVFTGLVGVLIAPGHAHPFAAALAVLAIALGSGAAGAINMWYERDLDALMTRTANRPLPAGRVAPEDARIFGLALSAAGLALLAARANWLSAALALATLLTYVLIYTPMKRRTPLSTIVGALPGALPALIGWTASHGRIDLSGAALFAIVFCWQLPHFMAIAWLYRDDYGKAGFPMLSVIDPGGRRSGRQAVFFAAALVPFSLAPIASGPFFAAVLLLGLLQLALAVRFAIARSDGSARALFLGSITYLPLVWIALIADRLWL
jgi:protoheme IX farnesyltransferase